LLIPSGHTDTNASFQVGQAAVGALDQILRNLFADDDLVRSHFLHVGATSPAGHAKAMPLALSELAADRAGDYWGLLHHQEHKLDTVDAFVQFCSNSCARTGQWAGTPGPSSLQAPSISVNAYFSRSHDT